MFFVFPEISFATHQQDRDSAAEVVDFMDPLLENKGWTLLEELKWKWGLWGTKLWFAKAVAC